MAKEHNFNINNVQMNRDFKYVETIDSNEKDADYCTTDYKGNTYKVDYLDGCFNPFIIKIK